MNRTTVSLLIVAVTLGTITGGAVSATPSAESVGPSVVSSPAPTHTSVIVAVENQGFDGDAQFVSTILDHVYGDDVNPTMALDGIDVIAAEVTPEGLSVLESLDLVRSVSVARNFKLALDVSVPQIGASTLHAGGLTGDGKVVVVIDSGVDWNHPGLTGSVVSEACFTNGANAALVTGTSVPMPAREVCQNGSLEQIGLPGAGLPCTLIPEECSHGTTVAGIITGSEPGHIGVAPGAAMISIRVTAVVHNPISGFDVTYIPEQGVLKALDHVLTLSSSFDIVAVNLSLGGPAGACHSSTWEAVVDQLGVAGIAVVAASGNGASDSSISFPACLPDVVSVGASSPLGEVSAFTDSSDLLDLVAPGESIDSTVPPSGYSVVQGTSFSAPHVAAAYALLSSTFANFGVDRMRNLLRSTGRMVSRTSPDPSGRVPRFPEIRVDTAAGFVPFVDVSGDDFWVGPADWAKATGVSNGVDGINFDAGGVLNRSQAVTFLWRFMGEPTASFTAQFTDLVPGKFYVPAVDWAAETGVTTGAGGSNLFDPEGAVTRGQLATFMWRVVGSPIVAPAAGFVDVDPVVFFATAVDWMAANGITTGTSPSTFSPDEVVDRAQMVTFLQRLASTASSWSGAVAPPALVLF